MYIYNVCYQGHENSMAFATMYITMYISTRNAKSQNTERDHSPKISQTWHTKVYCDTFKLKNVPYMFLFSKY